MDGYKTGMAQEFEQTTRLYEQVQAWFSTVVAHQRTTWWGATHRWVVWDPLVVALEAADPLTPVLAPRGVRSWLLGPLMGFLGLQPGLISQAPTWRWRVLAWGLKCFGLWAQPTFPTALWLLPEHGWHRHTVAYQLYHWLCEQQGLSGYSPQARQLYAQYGHQLDAPDLAERFAVRTMDQIKALQAAIRREMEALRVTYELA